MNDVTLNELKILVERAVRPVRATMVRKRRMREELLAHLAATFEEEAARLGDERAALDRAAERFGNPAGLTAELQQSVPRRDRLCSTLEALGLRPGESLMRMALRLAAFTAILAAVLWLALFHLCLFRNRLWELGLQTYVLFVVSVSSVAMSYVFTALTVGIFRATEDHDVGRRRRLLRRYAAISMTVFPVFALLWNWTLTGDLALLNLVNGGLVCCVALLTPLLLFGAVRSQADQMRHNEEWAHLRIEQ